MRTRIIKRRRLKARVKQALLEAFVSWLEQRFKSKGKQEIEAMLLGELPRLEDTQSGKDLIRIGEERGEKRGLDKGAERGFEQAIETFLHSKHGRLPKRVRGKLEKLTLRQSQQVMQHLPHWNSLDEVESWLDGLDVSRGQ